MKKIYSLALAALVSVSGMAETISMKQLPAAPANSSEKVVATMTAKGAPVKMPKKKGSANVKASAIDYDNLTWTSIGTGTLKNTIISNVFNITELNSPMSVTIQQAQTQPGVYRVLNASGTGRTCNMIVDATDPANVIIPYQFSGITETNNGVTYFASYSWYIMNEYDYTADEFKMFFPELCITFDQESKCINFISGSTVLHWPEAPEDASFYDMWYDSTGEDGYIILPGGTLVSPWDTLGTGTFSESILTPIFRSNFADTSLLRSTAEVEVQSLKQAPGFYRVNNPWKGLYQLLSFSGESPAFVIDLQNPANGMINQTAIGISSGGNANYICSYSYYMLLAGSSASDTPAEYRISVANTEETVGGKKYAVTTFTFPYRSFLRINGTGLYLTGNAGDTDPSTIIIKKEIIPEFTFNFVVKNAAGAPAANANVTMTPEGGNPLTLTTDAQGKASTMLQGYYNGVKFSYSVTGVTGMLDYTGTFTVSDLITDVNVTMEENPNKDFTFNFNVKDDDGNVVPNCVINVTPAVSSAFTLTTNAQGIATKTLTGPYASSTINYSIAATNKYEAASGQLMVADLVTNVNIVLQVKHHDVAIAFTVVDNNNEPLTGATIEVTDAEEEVVATIVTDENGYAKTAAFSDANGKTYFYTITCNKHEEAAGQVTLLNYDTTVSPYTYNCNVMLTRMTDVFVIEFNVSDANNESVAGAAINLTEGSTFYGSFVTDENGYAASAPLINMHNKTLSFTVKAANYEDYEGTVQVADYDDFDLPYYVVSDIVLTKKEVGVVDGIEMDDADVRYFNLQGVEIAKPAKGQVVIRVKDNKSSKVVY